MKRKQAIICCALLAASAISFMSLTCNDSDKGAGSGIDTTGVSNSATATSASSSAASTEATAETSADIPAGAAALIKAYPEQKLTYRDNKIWFPDGTGIVYDDGKKKDFAQQLDDSDIEDMFAMPYEHNEKPNFQADGGRSRSEALYKKMYGSSKEAVAKHLVKVDWFGQKLSMTTVNGVDKVTKELAADIAKHPELKKYMENSSSWYWRKVRGANRQSAHSYGMTIDVNTKFSDYWQWAGGTNNEYAKVGYKNRIPRELVDIFERHGFIWGGYWYHYDTMHFEYRPELLIYHGFMK